MISAIAMAFGLAAAGMLSPPHAQPQSGTWGTVSGTSALNLRTCASTTCPRIAAMPGGARVFVDGATGGWYHLNYNGAPGYASARYIATGAVAPAAPPAYAPQSPPSSSPSSPGRSMYGY